jgi:serine O-acetyltransferase
MSGDRRHMFQIVRSDLIRFSHGSTFLDKLKSSFTSIGFTTVVLIRLQSFFYQNKLIFLSYFVHHLNLTVTGADVLPGCEIGPGLKIEHPVGIVIGAGVKIGENCTILQGVTIGVKLVSEAENDHKYPTIGNNVTIGSKASILGGVVIGSNSIIGAHSVVVRDARPGSVLIGIPAREVKNTEL